MATETCSNTTTREPIIPVRLSENLSVDCVIDIGFSGGLMLPTGLLTSLRILIIGQERFELVSGSFIVASVALAEITWLGEPR